jgi:zinc D-Ala-D-Ala carboxypeptidase
VATVSAAGLEVAQGWRKPRTRPCRSCSHLDTLRWTFIAVALAGITVTIYARTDD